VQFKEFTDVEFGLLENFDFSDVDIMKWVDALAGLFNVLADGVRDQLADNLCKNNVKLILNLKTIRI
jgi:hypothetical protein